MTLCDPHTWQVPAYDTVFWNGKKSAYAVVIPVINEGERIRSLVRRMAALGIPGMADVFIVDAGSTDGSLERSFLESQGVSGVLLKTGSGKLSSQLRCAYAFLLQQDYEGIVTIDGNDKDDPDPIPAFIEALKKGVDFVQASRYIKGGLEENTPFVRTLAIRLIHAPLLSLASGFRWTDTTQGFRAYSRRMLMDPQIGIFRDVFLTYELLAYLSYRAPRLGYRCLELPTARRYPQGEIPTKISAVRGNLLLMKNLLKTCLGHYNPPGELPQEQGSKNS